MKQERVARTGTPDELPHEHAQAGAASQDSFTSQGHVPPTAASSTQEHDRSPTASERAFTELTTEGETTAAASPSASFKYAQMPGRPFVEGYGDKADIDPDDVRQGAAGDCWFLSG